jgi:beta-phosphoglucomutase-like phosphatase (HAD superfamily)/dTDP-glucose pyrophosphorylase
MIKLIIFDLDGVLVDTKHLHHTALYLALELYSPEHAMYYKTHKETFEALPTKEKIKILVTKFGLNPELEHQITRSKHGYFEKSLLKALFIRNDVGATIETLKGVLGDVCMFYIATNCTRKSLNLIVDACNIRHVDKLISWEDIQMDPKPSSMIYQWCMLDARVSPHETLVIEDSFNGITSALTSGAHVMQIKEVMDANAPNILAYINDSIPTQLKWKHSIQVVIPMAGKGSRFASLFNHRPKPLIDVHGKSMIQWALDALPVHRNSPSCTFIFVVQRKHVEMYHIDHVLRALVPSCHIVELDEYTQGACQTVMAAEHVIDPYVPLLLANSDQYVEWDGYEFLRLMNKNNYDGGIVTFTSSHPKWSYVGVSDDTGLVDKVAEKSVISDHATVGIYYWKRAIDFLTSAKHMIDNNIRSKGEFYVCPVYNVALELIKQFRIKAYNADAMWGLGTPEDRETFLKNFKKNDDFINAYQ